MNQNLNVKGSRSRPNIINNGNDMSTNPTWLVFLAAAYYQFTRINGPNANKGMTVWDAQWSAFFYGRSLAYTIHYFGREIYDDTPHPEYGRSYDTLDTPVSTDTDKIELILDIIRKLVFGYIRIKLDPDGGSITIYASLVTQYIKPTLYHIRLRHVWCNPMVTSLPSDSILTAEIEQTENISQMDDHHNKNEMVSSKEAEEEEPFKPKKKENIFKPGKEGYITFRNRLKDIKYWKMTQNTFHQIERYCVY